ncbi:MAG: Asp-tRNA(Asn)/Glu-tRNA(Gln) amidotransferase subunit GatB [Coriobacteriales bacterium]|jgi:aspartyl-tRNA(Asn)/glutamyl-tRNA(Gln) amidotransferase subunit B|nr:Asp-tRNA(Asn)/Glu-tRNA(Gln) amidotransferase subunit GatB [Coriobacteriales bacterium]
MKDLLTVLKDWEAVIGLEVHTELTTLNTKMFCSCPIEFGAEPNTHVCPVCLGLPGALPVPNRAAIESIVLAGLATNCEIEKRSMFYRKNYFYPDMSKNFQTTQGPVAFCMRGWLDLEVNGAAARERVVRAGTLPLLAEDGTGTASDVTGAATATPAPPIAQLDGYVTHIGITRIHMEEDAGKTVHYGGTDGRITGATYSLLDYNRCGTPLIELVTEPDLRTPEEARLFLQQLRQIYLTLGISDCSMEEGSLRCDGNVSLRRRGEVEFGTKTELKNMNSFKNLHDGLAYEICRQAEVLESGGTVRQETRHWEPAAKRTVTMRVKETADDYRLFPEPDLAPYDLTDEFIESVRARLPELPDAKRQRYTRDYGLPRADAANLAGDASLSAFFDATLQSSPQVARLAPRIANLLLNEVSAWLNAHNTVIENSKLTPQHLAQLAELLAGDSISSKQAKEVLAQSAETGASPQQIVEQSGIKQVSDAGELEAIVAQILAANPDKVAEYRSGKTGLIGFFVGQAMKATQGQGNPKLINEMFTQKLEV